MSIFTILIILAAASMIVWVVWFIINMIRYIRSGEYEMDQRLREVCK